MYAIVNVIFGMITSANALVTHFLFFFSCCEYNGMQDTHTHTPSNTHVAVEEGHLSEEEKSVREENE